MDYLYAVARRVMASLVAVPMSMARYLGHLLAVLVSKTPEPSQLTTETINPSDSVASVVQAQPPLPPNLGSSYIAPIDTLGKYNHQLLLTARESDEQVGSLTYDGLHLKLMRYWSSQFAQALIDSKSLAYRSWLSYFIHQDFPYGTVHAWAKAAVQSPNRFLLPDGPSAFTLLPEYFDKYGEVVEGCRVGGEPEVDRGGNVIARDDINCVRRVWDICANQVIPR